MNGIIAGFYYGFRDFLHAPSRLLKMHNQIVSQRIVRRQRGSLAEQQVQRRLQLQQANEVMFGVGFGGKSASAKSNEEPSQPHSSSSVVKFSHPTGIIRPLICMWSINVTFFTVIAVLLTFTRLGMIADFVNSRPALSFVGMIVSTLCRLSLLMFTETVNFVFLKKILDQIANLSIENDRKDLRASQQMQAQSFNPATARQLALSAYLSSSVGGTIVDRLYAIIFYSLYDTQWLIMSKFVGSFGGILYAFGQALLYACYAFEYLWRNVSNDTFHKFLMNILHFWPYFMGYGCPLGVALALVPDIFGWSGVVLSISYPLLVIGALSVPWNPLDLKNAPEDGIMPVLRIPLALSTYPALHATNLMVNVLEKCASFLVGPLLQPDSLKLPRRNISFGSDEYRSPMQAKRHTVFSSLNTSRQERLD